MAKVFRQRGLDFKRKKGIDYVTPQDLAFERQIIKSIKNHFPWCKIIGEETGEERKPSKWVVYIDPICGSANLAFRMYPFCTNIAFVKDGKAKIGFVIDYASRQGISAVADKEGIFVNGTQYQKPSQLEKKIGVVNVDLGHTLEYPLSKREGAQKLVFLINKLIFLKNPYYFVCFSSSVALAYVALGKLDAFIGTNFQSQNHDLVAGAFLVEKSGGTIINWQGNSWQLGEGKIIAAKNKEIAMQILGLLK